MSAEKCMFLVHNYQNNLLTFSQLPVTDRVVELKRLTSSNNLLGTTEVSASVTVLITATEGVSGNLTVRNYLMYFCYHIDS